MFYSSIFYTIRERANANQRRERNADRDRDPRDDYRGGRRRSDVKYERNEPRGGYDHYNGGGESAMNRSNVGYGQQPPMHHQQVDPRLYNNNQHQQQTPSPMQAPMQTAPQLEQAQKAQQILSMLTHQQQTQQVQQAPQAQPSQISYSSPYQPHVSATSPPVPSQPHLLQQPFVQPVPPTEDQASQVQQLLGLLVKKGKEGIQLT